MTDVVGLLRRQWQWQRSRASLPWPEKIRMAAEMREGVLTLRRGAKRDQEPVEPPAKPTHPAGRRT
jgi:hypothetical protein